MKKIILLLLISFTFYNCSNQKEVLYFQNLKTGEKSEISPFKDTRIQTNDLLDIRLKTLDPKTVALFSVSDTRNGANNINPLESFLVTDSGDIKLPLIGLVKAAGLTTTELELKVEEELKLYVKDPMVTVRLINFKVTVLGEVLKPGVITFYEEGITLPQAIAAAGDLTITGKRENILLVRSLGDKKESIRIDLTNKDLFNSPYYYLQQNDILYVEPNYRKIKSAGLITNLTGILGIFTSVLGIILIVK